MRWTATESGEQVEASGQEGHSMDIVERCFFVTAVTCLSVLVGVSLLGLDGLALFQ
jgi:hypothetical protein